MRFYEEYRCGCVSTMAAKNDCPATVVRTELVSSTRIAPMVCLRTSELVSGQSKRGKKRRRCGGES